MGDNAATYPKLMATAGSRGADERTVNEVAGWLFRSAFQSAAHMTDYSIDAGTAYMLGGSRTDELVRLCVRAGLLEEFKVAGVRSFKLIEDPEFIHIRLRKEVEWERQQRNDTRDPRLRVPVLLRDGDQCRYCAVVVMWRGKTSNRSGSIDHRVPGEPGTVDTMVVACMRCNSARTDNPQWDDDHPLLPPPRTPVYSKFTVAYLATNGQHVQENLSGHEHALTRTPGADPAPLTGVRPATASSAELAPKSPPNSPGRPDGTDMPGSGLVGSASGSAGSGLDGPSPGSARRRRGRRGGRSQSSAARGDS